MTDTKTADAPTAKTAQTATAGTKTIAAVLYPGLTPLDVIGPLQVLAALADFGPGFEVVTVAGDTAPVATDAAVRLCATHTFDQVARPFALLVPGGVAGTFATLVDDTVIGYVREAARTAGYVTSVCTGSLVIGMAGLLANRRATTHWGALPMLRAFGAEPVSERWVDEGTVITAAGVSAGVDMALHLVARLAGEDVARTVQAVVEYDPEPPFGPLDWERVDRGPFRSWVTGQARSALHHHPALLGRLLDTMA